MRKEHEIRVCVDASSLATSVVVESGGSLVEDACCLRPVHENKHINLAELEAMLRGINVALQWKATVVQMKSAYITGCTGKTRVRTKAASEMLIRLRLGTLEELAAEYGLTIDVGLVRSHANQTEQITRVSQ